LAVSIENTGERHLDIVIFIVVCIVIMRKLTDIAHKAVSDFKEIGVGIGIKHGVNNGGVAFVAIKVDFVAARAEKQGSYSDYCQKNLFHQKISFKLAKIQIF
jgi:hypothetical protein